MIKMSVCVLCLEWWAGQPFGSVNSFITIIYRVQIICLIFPVLLYTPQIKTYQMSTYFIKLYYYDFSYFSYINKIKNPKTSHHQPLPVPATNAISNAGKTSLCSDVSIFFSLLLSMC